jgi:hypothetical protein
MTEVHAVDGCLPQWSRYEWKVNMTTSHCCSLTCYKKERRPYDLDGWTVPDLINPDDVNVHMKKFK